MEDWACAAALDLVKVGGEGRTAADPACRWRRVLSSSRRWRIRIWKISGRRRHGGGESLAHGGEWSGSARPDPARWSIPLVVLGTEADGGPHNRMMEAADLALRPIDDDEVAIRSDL
ncbi:hypothetical protein Dimus_012882 [Dionaea muscipula]